MSEEFKILNDVSHARLRTEMYLGSRALTDVRFPVFNPITREAIFQDFVIVPAVLTAFREAFDNALDILRHEKKGRVDVEYYEDISSFSVKDNGAGIPHDRVEAEDARIPTLAVSKKQAGTNFGERDIQAGTNGVGISIVNYCSVWFKLETARDGKKFIQDFKATNDELIIGDYAFVKEPKSGTKVSFRLSPEVFHNGLNLPWELVYSYLILVAMSNPSLTITLNKVEVVSGRAVGAGLHGFRVNIANDSTSGVLAFSKGNGDVFTTVNNIPTYTGGKHIDEIRLSFPKALLAALAKESKRRKLNPTRADVLDCVNVIGSLRVNNAVFEGQAKTQLTSTEVRPAISKAIESADWSKFIKDEKGIIEAIYALCAARSGKKDAGAIDQNAKELKKAKIAKLVDATSRIRSQCTLYLAEGDSAAGGAVGVRNPETDAVMPLRGKITNVYGVPARAAVNTDKESVIKDMCAAIGLVPGKKANVSDLRYSRVILTVDADEDGQGSIAPLIINFFYQYWPELFAGPKPFIFIFIAPLIIVEKGKERKYFYPHTLHEFDASKFKGWTITRAKGLGSMSPQNFRDQMEKPILVPILENDRKHLGKIMSLLFNDKRSDDRKEMMEMDIDSLMTAIDERGLDWKSETNELDV